MIGRFPEPLRGNPTPAQIARAFNQLLDWLRANQALPGRGIEVVSSRIGLIFNVSQWGRNE